MMLVEFGDDLIAVDCGLMFPDDELPGVDYVIPDFTYALERREGFRGVVLTHGHEDHIGALPYLLRVAPVPVYGTPLTLALMREKLREHGLLDGADLRPMRPREAFELGPFRVEAIRVTHSIVDGMGLAIDTPVGTVVLTGDFKLDPSPLDGEPSDDRRFAELGRHGVLVLCSNSTNVGRPGHTPSEIEVGAALAARFVHAIGRVINALYRRGAEVLYDDNAFVHVSGHASQDDLKRMLELTQPRYFVPVHGEYRHLLGHARLAASTGLAPERIFLIEDGAGLEVTKTSARVIAGFPAGRVLVDGKGVGDVGAVVLRDRQLLADDGVIAVSLTVDGKGHVLAGPEIASRGVFYMK